MLLVTLALGLSATLAPIQDSPAARFPSASPIGEGISPDSLAKLDELIQGFVDADEIVGGELLVIKNGRSVLHNAYGWRNREEQVAMETGSVFCVRSMTKPLIGSAILMLLDEKQLKLDDPVAQYLPAFDVESTRTITIEQLLNHNSGLPMSLIMGKKLLDLDGIQAVAQLGAGYELEFDPGSAFQYSDQGTDTLTALLEVVSGMTAAEFIQTRILDPLGMQDTATVMHMDSPLRERGCSKYMGTRKAWTRFWSPQDEPLFPFFLGSQGLYSTLEDYARFMDMWLRKGKFGKLGKQRLIGARYMRKALKPGPHAINAPSGFPEVHTEYGFLTQLWMGPGKRDKDEVIAYGHTGSDGTHAWIFPGQKAMVLYFTQSRGTNTGLQVEEILGELLLGVPFDANQAAPPFEEYLGYYWEGEGDLYRGIVRDGDDLALEILATAIVPLTYLGEDRWKLRPQPKYIIEFDRDESGAVTGYHIGDHQEFRVPPPAGLPSAAELTARAAAVHGMDLLETLGPLRMSGEIKIPKVGVEGTFDTHLAWPNLFRTDNLVAGEFEHLAYDGEHMRLHSKAEPKSILEGDRAQHMLFASPFVRFGDWSASNPEVVLIQQLVRGGKNVYVLRSGDANAPRQTLYLDAESGRVVREDGMAQMGAAGRVGQRLSFGDYREISGMLLPYRTEIELANKMIGTVTSTITDISLGVTIPDGLFTLED
ncbi:MAG: CubicO group peptidase (beta-lactamase class C family) [Planctomycetota bacterium]|jgi:CubicO group peptidase (beta-lactamase class C family)